MDVTHVTTLSTCIFKRREIWSTSERTATVVESGSVGITAVIPSRGPPGGSPGWYYVKVVADEESLR